MYLLGGFSTDLQWDAVKITVCGVPVYVAGGYVMGIMDLNSKQ